MGTGVGHYIPLLAYVGFWAMCLVSLSGRPLPALYYLLPFVPYRTMRDHFADYPLGNNVLTILILAVILGALLKGKRIPPSRMYLTWFWFGLYLYISLWLGTVLSGAPAPLWLSDINFVTWKDYMLIPLVFVAAGLVIEDRKAIENHCLVRRWRVRLAVIRRRRQNCTKSDCQRSPLCVIHFVPLVPQSVIDT